MVVTSNQEKGKTTVAKLPPYLRRDFCQKALQVIEPNHRFAKISGECESIQGINKASLYTDYIIAQNIDLFGLHLALLIQPSNK